MSRLSPAQQHVARVLAAKTMAASKHGEALQGSAYDLMFAKLVTDKQRLKAIQSIQKKIDLKRQILPEYKEWIDGALQFGNGAQDMVLTTLLVWHIDAGDFGRALEIAKYCLVHDLSLPDQYNRDVPTMLLDEIPGAYLAGRFESPAAAIDILKEVKTLTEDADAPDQASAKLYKALGYAQIGKVGNSDIDFEAIPETSATSALENLKKALTLHDGAGVKKDIERLERRLKKAPDTTAQETPLA